jgi:hypothetical protein
MDGRWRPPAPSCQSPASATSRELLRLRHPRAKQGAKRRGADPGIHSVTSAQECSGSERRLRPPLRQWKIELIEKTNPEGSSAERGGSVRFWSAGALPRGDGMDPRVCAASLRSLLRPRMTKWRMFRPISNVLAPCHEIAAETIDVRCRSASGTETTAFGRCLFRWPFWWALRSSSRLARPRCDRTQGQHACL